MKLRFLSLVLFLLGPPLFAQQVFGPFTITSSSSPCATVDISGAASVGIVVNGTFSMTLQPEVAIAGQAAGNTKVVPAGSTSSSAQSTITTTGYYKGLDIAPYTLFELCPASYSSGTATIYFKISPQVTASLFGGSSGGGGTVTSVSGTTNQIDVASGTTTPVISFDANFASGGLSFFGTGSTTSAQLLALLTNPTGSGLAVFQTSPTLVTPLLGTPTSGVITNLTGTCTACVANSAGSVSSAATFNNGGSGAASGQTYNGSAAETISYNTVGAADLILNNLGTTAINAALLPGTTSSIALGSASFFWSNLFATAGTIGIAGTTGGVLSFAGATSGDATLTAPAVAGTTSNPLVSSNAIQFPNGATSTPSIVFAASATQGFYSNSSTKACYTEGGTDTFCMGAANIIPDNATYAFSQTNSASGTISASTGIVGSGATEWINPSTPNVVTTSSVICKIGSPITLTSQTTICSFTLPNAATSFGYQCSGMYQASTTAITMTLGTIFAHAPTLSTHQAIIWSAASTQTYGSAANTGTTAVTTMTGVADAASGAPTPWQASGTFTSSGTSGTFILYGTPSTSGDIQINAGSSCQIF